jgi:hypothetical protein
MYCVINLNELTLTDENTQSQIDQRELQSGITVTPNEVRARKGLPPATVEIPNGTFCKGPNGPGTATLDAQAEQQAAALKAQKENAKVQAKRAHRYPAGKGRRGAGQGGSWTGNGSNRKWFSRQPGKEASTAARG